MKKNTRQVSSWFVRVALIALVSPGAATAANTITFSGEVTDQTCQVSVSGSADPTIILDSVPVSGLASVGAVAGETPFTVSLSGCSEGVTEQHYTTVFQAVTPTADGNLANAASAGATGVAIQLLDGEGGMPVNLAGGAAVEAGDIVLPAGETEASYNYAVQYVSESAEVTPGPVLASVIYSLRYE